MRLPFEPYLAFHGMDRESLILHYRKKTVFKKTHGWRRFL